MFMLEILRAVLDAIRTNRIRFLLTLSGVIVGSASMVLLSGLLAGGKEALIGASHGAAEADLIEVKARGVPDKQRHKTRRMLDRGDVSTLDESELLGDARVVGLRDTWEEATWEKKRRRVALVGTRIDALDLYRLKLAKGRFFSDDDVREMRRVAVVGQKVYSELYGAPAALDGLEVRAGGARFAVIGVLEHKAQMGGGDGPWLWDNRVLLPDTTYATSLTPALSERRMVERVFVRLSEVRNLADRIGAVRDVVSSTILRRHYGVKNFKVSGDESDNAGQIILLVISILIMATAVVSLVVGGINVMNIMLVSITERTREIGVRRAVGAPRTLIMAQFLAESTLTAALGGLIGVLFGAGMTFVASLILDKLTGGWAFHLVPWAPPLALGAAMLVGATFGLYPAWRASRLDPVEALRYE